MKLKKINLIKVKERPSRLHMERYFGYFNGSLRAQERKITFNACLEGLTEAKTRELLKLTTPVRRHDFHEYFAMCLQYKVFKIQGSAEADSPPQTVPQRDLAHPDQGQYGQLSMSGTSFSQAFYTEVPRSTQTLRSIQEQIGAMTYPAGMETPVPLTERLSPAGDSEMRQEESTRIALEELGRVMRGETVRQGSQEVTRSAEEDVDQGTTELARDEAGTQGFTQGS